MSTAAQCWGNAKVILRLLLFFPGRRHHSRIIRASRSWQVVFVLQLLSSANSNQATKLHLQRGQQKQEGSKRSKYSCCISLSTAFICYLSFQLSQQFCYFSVNRISECLFHKMLFKIIHLTWFHDCLLMLNAAGEAARQRYLSTRSHWSHCSVTCCVCTHQVNGNTCSVAAIRDLC